MTNTTSGASPVTAIAELDQAISEKLDFVFSYQDEDSLLTLRSLLGFARRLVYVRDNMDSSHQHIKVPLKREPKCIGASLKEIIEDADYDYSVAERTGYSIVALTGASPAAINNLVTACLIHVAVKLEQSPIKFS